MLEQAFQDVYTKFKLHFYQNIFQRFATREATLTTVVYRLLQHQLLLPAHRSGARPRAFLPRGLRKAGRDAHHRERGADAGTGPAQKERRISKNPSGRWPGGFFYVSLLLLFIHYLDLALLPQHVGGQDADGQHHDDKDAHKAAQRGTVACKTCGKGEHCHDAQHRQYALDAALDHLAAAGRAGEQTQRHGAEQGRQGKPSCGKLVSMAAGPLLLQKP